MSYFSNAQGTTIGSHANFQTVLRDAITVTNNYRCTKHRDDRVIVCEKTIRKILDSDINYLRIRSSEILSVRTGIREQGPASSTLAIRVRKTVKTAEIVPYQGIFTTTTLEPVDDTDRGQFKLIARRVLVAAVCQRSPLLTQFFGVADSNPLTLIAYNDLSNGNEWFGRYWGKNLIVEYYYLLYTFIAAVHSLRNDETLALPVTDHFEDWSFDLKTLAWHFDPASVSLSSLSEDDLQPYPNRFAPLNQETLRELNPDKIVACIENNWGDFLALVGSWGGKRFQGLLNYAHHGLLTFGTIVDCNKPRILAHFPSTPPPVWLCHSRNSNAKVNFSMSAPWRVELSFRKTGDIQVELDFGLHIPETDRVRLAAAYLSQSLSFTDDCDDVRDIVYVHEVGFILVGTFCGDPANCSTPPFLFVPPFPTKFINNMHCIQFPLREMPFYWSFDKMGKSRIAENDWEKFNVPKLRLKTWIGSNWYHGDYMLVREFLTSRSYNLGGRQYAREHGHPELIQGDPHDTKRFEEVEDSEFVGTPPPHLPLTSPSTFSLVEAPLAETEAAPVSTTVAVSFAGWAKGFLNKHYKGKVRGPGSSAPRETEWDMISHEETS